MIFWDYLGIGPKIYKLYVCVCLNVLCYYVLSVLFGK
jgi:hypothetical protein